MKNQVAITGIGLLSSLGEGRAAHARLFDGAVPATVLPYGTSLIHPLGEINFDSQIPKKGDQRQMEMWQRIGVYAAGLALEDAGIKGKEDLLSKTHMIVAAGGGERDEAVDCSILNGLAEAQDKEIFLNEKLTNDLRPTLFLAQLSNLLAGNISIVHNVTGSSRTFMGEEAAGMDAIRTLFARIESGQAELGLVGGAFNAVRKDMMINYACADLLLKPEFRPVWSRDDNHGGMTMGSMGAFLVLESVEHAKARGAKIHAILSYVETARSNRAEGIENNMRSLFAKLPQAMQACDAVISCASGVGALAAQEEKFWTGANDNVALRAVATFAGHGFEAAPVFATALAALSLAEKRYLAPQEQKERALAAAPQNILVSCCGHWRGEGLLALEAA